MEMAIFNCNVKIVDMIMGAGKTSAAINFINSADEDTRFLYITPYLDEVKRIKEACKAKKFIEPSAMGTKLKGLKNCISRGKNIVSTHALFQRFDEEIIDLCRAKNYTLIMDEVANVIERYDISKEDFCMLQQNYIEVVDHGFVRWREGADDYHGKFEIEKNLCNMGSLALYGGDVLMWLFPIKAFNAFRDIYILTYMFHAQIQRCYYDFYGLPYSYVYVMGDSPENFQFTNEVVEVQKKDYASLIDILEDAKMNQIGDRKHDLSKTWYERNQNNGTMKVLKDNTTNFFNNKRKTKSSENLWTTFKEQKGKIKGKGYTKGYESLNARASNKHKERISVAYLVNRYMNVGVKNFFLTHGIEVDEEAYATSEMLQFIWRSAIREGKPIEIYIPSTRMRNLLYRWISENTIKEEVDETRI